MYKSHKQLSIIYVIMTTTTMNLRQILEDEQGLLKNYADEKNLNFEADKFFVANLYFKEKYNLCLVDMVFDNLLKNVN